jgi:FtsP/CotA-like multicopper oxidase with cupredoxin domain
MTDHPSPSTSPAASVRARPFRGLVPHAVLALATVIAGAAAACAPGVSAPSSVAMARPAAAATGLDSLRDPLTISSVPVQTPSGVRNILDVEMHAVMAPLRTPTNTIDTLRTWKITRANGVPMDSMGYPGPTFVVSPGDSVRILLVNKLPEEEPLPCVSYKAYDSTFIDKAPDCFHQPNSTNIHFHGFHVSPEDYADNVLIEILPDSTHQYAFGIPANQSPGTHWYHPHKHGSVALQVSNGMSGAFLVTGGGLDSITQNAVDSVSGRTVPMRDRLVAIQQIGHQVNLVRDTLGDPPYAINGQVNPVIVMQPGEVQRWRIVNENVAKPANYAVFFDSSAEPVQMFDAARDGVQFAPGNYDPVDSDDSLLVAPGNRLDVFVKAPSTPGLHSMRVRPVAEDDVRGVGRRERVRVRARNPNARLSDAQINREAEAPVTLLNVYVPEQPTTTGYATVLPRSLPALPSFLGNLQDPGGIQETVVFADSGLGGQGLPAYPPRFYLGTAANPLQQFEPDSNFLYLPLNKTQNWRVENRSINQLPHPFHIHINPFQVTQVFYPRGTQDSNYQLYEQLNRAAASGNPIWLDVIPLPQPTVDSAHNLIQAGYITIRQRYEDFTGAYVMHCHILGHEERGMMQRITVTPTGQRPSAAASPPSGSHGAAHQH